MLVIVIVYGKVSKPGKPLSPSFSMESPTCLAKVQNRAGLGQEVAVVLWSLFTALPL